MTVLALRPVGTNGSYTVPVDVLPTAPLQERGSAPMQEIVLLATCPQCDFCRLSHGAP